MNQLQVFENELFKVSAKLDGEQALFDVEQVARSLGFTTVARSGNETIRWSRVNSYLPDNLPQVAKGDFIPEPLVYKLAFKAKNELAEKFQDWLAIEVIPSIRKTGSYQKPQTHLEVLQGTINQLIEQDKKLNELEGQVNNISNIVTLTSDEWREKVKVILRKIAQKWSGIEPYRSVINLSYERFEKRAGCKLDVRLNNRKERALAQGMTKTYIKKINKLDCIAEEKRLVEIYIQVVKEMAIEHKVAINDFKFQEVI
ncbi:BRO-N domain-containing protein [Virgibacillus kimchii]